MSTDSEMSESETTICDYSTLYPLDARADVTLLFIAEREFWDKFGLGSAGEALLFVATRNLEELFEQYPSRPYAVCLIPPAEAGLGARVWIVDLNHLAQTIAQAMYDAPPGRLQVVRCVPPDLRDEIEQTVGEIETELLRRASPGGAA